MPFIPIVGIGFSLWLISGLPWQSYERFGIWLVIGLVVYFGYGIRKSKLAGA
ncbi:MAG: amino acid permease C-terminal domain-containing protein [Luteimonas sp.]